MSNVITVNPGLLSAMTFEENEDIGAPEGKFLVGFYLPNEYIKDFSIGTECTITFSEPKA